MTRRLVVRAVLVALLAAPLVWVSYAVTLSLLVTRRDPARAVWLWSGNSLAHAALARQIVTDALPAVPSQQASTEAVKALAEDPGNPVAARVMGVMAGLKGGTQTLGRWLAYSERNSRRDLETQIALIELAVSQGRVNEALVHYDRALRVFAPQPQLIDVLVRATGDAPVRQQLVAMLQTRPPWRVDYLIHLVESGNASPQTVDTMLRDMRLDQTDAFDRRILGEAVVLLANDGKMSAARALIGANGSAVRNGTFDENNSYPPLDWRLANDPNLSGVIEQGVRERGGKALFLDARNDTSGTVAEQILSLAPGRYSLSLAAGDVSLVAGDAPTITIGCVGHNTPLSSASLPSGTTALRQTRLSLFTVPLSCPAQRIAIAATTSVEGGTRPWVDDVRIVPLP